MNDCFVPRYSAIMEGRPKWVVLIGVWLIFGLAGAPLTTVTMNSGELVMIGGTVVSSDPLVIDWMAIGLALSLGALELLILGKFTWRFIAWRLRGRSAA